jgi:hypothetical protein
MQRPASGVADAWDDASHAAIAACSAASFEINKNRLSLERLK